MDDAARLSLARRAWRATAPSDQEIDAGVRRLRIALATQRGRRPIARRTVAAGVGALVLGAALAYAAHSAWTSSGPAPTSPPDTPKLGQVPNDPRPASAPRRGTSEGSEHTSPMPETAADAPRFAASTTPSPRAEGSAQGVTSSPTDTVDRTGEDRPTDPTRATGSVHSEADADTLTWRQVDEALSRGKSARARAALERLTQSRDVVTRAKARLGLAQLAASAGDCQRARALVAQLGMSPGVPAELVARGRRLALQCK